MRALLLGFAALACLFAPAIGEAGSAEHAHIQPGRGIGPVVLGQSAAHVRRSLGRPGRITTATDTDTSKIVEDWHYKARRLTLTLTPTRHGLRVGAVETTSRRYRTTRGAGVGSTERYVEDRVPRAECYDADTVRWCTTDAGDNTSPQTVFELRHGRGRLVRVVARSGELGQ